jgi:hypothetical protein
MTQLRCLISFLVLAVTRSRYGLLSIPALPAATIRYARQPC